MFKVGSDDNKPPVSSSSNTSASGSILTAASASFQGRTVSAVSQQYSDSFLPTTDTANRSVYHAQADNHPVEISLSRRNVQQQFSTPPLIPTREAPPPPTATLPPTSSGNVQRQFSTPPLIPTREAPPPPSSLESSKEVQRQQPSRRFSITEGASNKPAYEGGPIRKQYESVMKLKPKPKADDQSSATSIRARQQPVKTFGIIGPSSKPGYEDVAKLKPEEDSPVRPPKPLKYDYASIEHRGLPKHPIRFAIGDADPHKPEYENVLKMGTEGTERQDRNSPKRFKAFSNDSRAPEYENVAKIHNSLKMVRNPKTDRQIHPEPASDRSEYSTLKHNKGEDKRATIPKPLPRDTDSYESLPSSGRGGYSTLKHNKGEDKRAPIPKPSLRDTDSYESLPLSGRGGYSTLKHNKGEDKRAPIPNPSVRDTDSYESLNPSNKPRRASPPPPERPPKSGSSAERQRSTTPPPVPKRTYRAPEVSRQEAPTVPPRPPKPSVAPPLHARADKSSEAPPLPQRMSRSRSESSAKDIKQ